MTPASQRALEGLRDLSTIEWYVIPLLAIVFYIYAVEIKKARQSGQWNAVFAGVTLFGLDFINETWNGLIFHFTQHSAFWTVPGDSALRTMVGWNIEIMFMFAIAGIIYYHTLSENPAEKIFGIPNAWFWAIGYAAFCVFVECLLNIGGHLVWEYPWWNLSFGGILLIFLIGYLHFYLITLLVVRMRTIRAKITAVAVIYAIPIIVNAICLGALGWVY